MNEKEVTRIQKKQRQVRWNVGAPPFCHCCDRYNQSCGQFCDLLSLNNVASCITPRGTCVTATKTCLCQQRPPVWCNVCYCVHSFQLYSLWGYPSSWMLATLISFRSFSHNVLLHLPNLQ